MFRIDNPLLRLLAINGVMGAGVGLAVVAALFAFDIAGLREIASQTDSTLVAVILLAAGFVVTFASVAMGSAVMLLPRDRDRWDRMR